SKCTPSEQFLRLCLVSSNCLFQARLVETRIGTNRTRRAEINHQHIDRTVGLRLEDKLPFEFERSAKQYGQNRCFRQQASDFFRIVVAFQYAVDACAKLNRAATYIEPFNLKGHDGIIACKAEITQPDLNVLDFDM